MAGTVTIADTKDLGYEYAKSQESIKFGLDLDYSGTGDKALKSTNMFDFTPSVEPTKKTVNPIDEKAGVTVNTSVVVSATQNSDVNLKNPVHVGLLKLANKIASGDTSAGTNIPYGVIDFNASQEAEGMCNVTPVVTTVGGEPRSMTVTYDFIGGIDYKDFTP